jgi:hypothetical protein
MLKRLDQVNPSKLSLSNSLLSPPILSTGSSTPAAIPIADDDFAARCRARATALPSVTVFTRERN